MDKLDILYIDKDILVCIKPPKVLSTDEAGGLPELLRRQLGDEAADVRTVHRLDRATSGLMVLARNARSASELREMLRRGQELQAHIPQDALEVFRREMELGRCALDEERMELAIMSRLRMLGEKDYLLLPDGGDGAGRRLYAAVRTGVSLREIVDLAAARRMPMSRVRRMCLCAALGIKKDMAQGLPDYARLLAATERGRKYLRDIDNLSTISVVTKPASVRHLGVGAQELFALGASAHDLFTLLYPAKEERKAGQDWRIGPKIV